MRRSNIAGTSEACTQLIEIVADCDATAAVHVAATLDPASEAPSAATAALTDPLEPLEVDQEPEEDVQEEEDKAEGIYGKRTAAIVVSTDEGGTGAGGSSATVATSKGGPKQLFERVGAVTGSGASSGGGGVTRVRSK